MVIPWLAVLSFVLCTFWLVRTFYPSAGRYHAAFGVGALILGLVLVYCFAFRRYWYNADWQIIGFPIPAVPLERLVWPDGTVHLKDWIGGLLLVGSLGNILFWLLLPSAPLALFGWLSRRWVRPLVYPST